MFCQLSSTYSHQGLAHALNIFNFPEDYTVPMFVTALRYICQNSTQIPFKFRLKKEEIINKTVDNIKKRMLEKRYWNDIIEIIDIFRSFIPEGVEVVRTTITDIRNRLSTELERKAEIQRNVEENINKKIQTVYQDKQNVHNSVVNKSVLTSCENLYERYKSLIVSINKNEFADSIKKGLGKGADSVPFGERPYGFHSPHDFSSQNLVPRSGGSPEESGGKVNHSIDYIRDSIAVFGKLRITLMDVLSAVWLYILESKDKEELKGRLVEELTDMDGKCSTGHLARIINVIQGFTENEELKIKIGVLDQCKSVVRVYLERRLRECEDEKVLSGMVEGSEEYKIFIRGCIKDVVKEWGQTYGVDMLDNIAGIVNEFCGTEIFRIKNKS